MKIKKPLILGVVAGLALSTAATITPAFADPVAGGYVAVGSDTLDSSMNALTNGTSATGSTVRITDGNGAAVGSFDAFGSSLIQTKSGGPFFQRPSGSGAGVSALTASIKGTDYGTKPVNITGQVDIARSSSGPGSNANASGKLAYVPYARDAVAYAYYGPDADFGSLTKAQLTGIYNGTITSINGTSVKPLIPQADSGTRKFFLKAIGIDSTGGGACSLAVCTNSATPENDASQLTEVGNIIPFSAANWIAQSNGVQVNTIPTSGNVKLGKPDSLTAYTGTAPSLVPSTSLYNSTTYGRDTYLVVEYDRIDSTSANYDATLAGLVDSTVSTSLTNFGTAPSQPGAVKKKYGFLAPSTTAVQRAYSW
jgi:ABC-type phosphate transport system substrate-binding protein